MIASNSEFIKQDYGYVMNNAKEGRRQHDSYSLRRFFRPNSADSALELANNMGEVYLQDLSDFISAKMFPCSGDWINFAESPANDQGQQQIMKEVKEGLNRHLLDSNFYESVNKLVTQGLIYNEGIISAEYSQGLSFVVYDVEKVHMSMENDVYLRRAYIEEDMTLLALSNKYEVDAEALVNLKGEATHLYKDYKVVHAILPVIKEFVKTDMVDKRYKFIKVPFLVISGDFTELKAKKSDSLAGFSSFPVMQYRCSGEISLARKAVSSANMANLYEQVYYDRAKQVLYPPIAIGVDTIMRGDYDLRSGGVVPLENNEREPGPIQTTLNMDVSEKTIVMKERKLREIFKVDLIERANITNISQFEYNQNQYNMLSSVQPLVADLTSRVVVALLERTHKLLLQNDPLYKRVAKGLEKEFHFDHLAKQMERARKLASVGRVLQAISPVANFDPQSFTNVNTDKLLREAFAAAGLSQVMRSEAEVRQMKAQMMEQQQQQQQAEQEAEQQPEAPPGPQQGQV